MRLKSLQISGFKSFGKKTPLGFSHSVSAIVGPNGSGKSNVAEAIAWVLGEQSVKSLRSKKGEDLIFNGSGTSSKLSKASVSLVFLKEDGGEETIVSRAVYRDGSNEYFINNSRVRLKDVVDFLNREGSGVVKHHIIRQGEADNILNSSIKERRDMIENALGLKIYKIKKEEAERKLNKTEENINQANSLRKEISPHLRFLKKQVTKANKSVELKEKLKNLCSIYFFQIENFINQNLEKFEKNIIIFKKEIEEKEKEIKNLEEEMKRFDGEKEKADKIRLKINDLEREIGRQEGILFHVRKKAQTQPKIENTKIKFSFNNVKKFATFLEKEIKKAINENDLESIKKSLSLIEKELKTVFKKEEAPKEIINEEKEDLKSEIKKIEIKHQELLAELKIAKKEEEDLKKENKSILDSQKTFYNIKMEANKVINSKYNLEKQKEDFLYKKSSASRHREEIENFLREKILDKKTEEGIGEYELEEKRNKIERLKIKLEESGGVGEEIIKEYEEINERDLFLEKEILDLEDSSKILSSLIAQLAERLDVDFKKGVLKINTEFQKFFESMFNGGGAELKIVKEKRKKKKEEIAIDEEIVEEENEEALCEDGIDIKVSLPRKKINSLGMLSGGERALTSIALLFALSQVNPPPFLILDETDAALDESNSRKYASMLKKLSDKTQLILITHNRETMNIAGILYGVTMSGDGISKLLSIKLEEIEEMAI